MRIWQILIFSFLIYSCGKKSNCPNETIITKPSDNDVTLKLNYNQDQKQLIAEVEKLYNEDICWEERTIGLELETGIIKTIFLKTCSDGSMRYIPPNSEIRILMNQKGETMLNYEIIKLDSIGNWIGKNFPNESDSEKEEIFFLWDKESPKEKIEEAFEQIRKGYLKSYDRISKDLFKRKFCELDGNELKKIKESLDFRVKLGFGEINIPPPPPQLSDEEINAIYK